MIKHFTKTLLGSEARAALKAGIDAVHAPVSVTMGAKGRNSVFREFGRPKPTNDGISIARRIVLEDEFEAMGADLIKQAAEKTVTDAGDGTSGTIVVTHALIDKGIESIENGKDPMQLRVELEAARDEVIAALKEMATPVTNREDILNVARVSVEDEDMAQIVADAVETAGKYGAVVVEEGSSFEIEKEDVKGYHWERGYVSPYMITSPERNEAVIQDCGVIVTDRYMNLNKDLMEVLNECKAKGMSQVLIICDRMEGELLQTLILNKVKGLMTSVVVTRPSSSEELEDIAILTNGTAVTKDSGIKDITWGHIGRAQKVIVDENKTTIICASSPALDQRVEILKDMVANEKDAAKKDSLIARLAKLSDGMVLIRVGAKTEAEAKYKKDKMDDAVSAAKAATEEGIVDGGGIALTAAGSQMTLDTDGAKVLKYALSMPYATILTNAGLPLDGKFYNVKTGKQVKNMREEGIIDPAKVARCVVENAVSLAGIFFTLESVIGNFQSGTEEK